MSHQRKFCSIQFRQTTMVTMSLVILCLTHIEIRASDSTRRNAVVIGKIECGRNISFNESKIEAGLALALELSQRYRLVSSRETDSLAKQIKSQHTVDTATPNISRIAQLLKADVIAFVRIDRLENIIRAEIQLASGEGYKSMNRGKGFALVRLKTSKKNRQLSDPAVLTALQRALCDAVRDSTLYDQQSGALRVKPAATLVAGGVKFMDDPSIAPWHLFANHTINGFDAVVHVFNALKDSKDYVCYDVDTRDSIFALFKLYLIENDAEPSREEIDALRRLEVQYYLTGTCQRTDKGAEIVMNFCQINENSTYTILRSASDTIQEDDIVEFRKKIEQLSRTLVEGN